jgi:hypothetical protein
MFEMIGTYTPTGTDTALTAALGGVPDFVTAHIAEILTACLALGAVGFGARWVRRLVGRG